MKPNLQYGVLIALISIPLLVPFSSGEGLGKRAYNLAVSDRSASSSLSITSISDNRLEFAGGQIPRFEKFEITFQVQNAVAQNFQLPYDPDPPEGIDSTYPKHQGISVDALFLQPGETDWNKAYRQPAFYYQYFDDQIKPGWDGRKREWVYPTGKFAWKVRFSPHLTGIWQYRLTAQDAAGSAQISPRAFTVIASQENGFLKVSPADPRYFAFDSGKPFHALGIQGASAFEDPLLANERNYQRYGQNGINLIRLWISSLYGTAWSEWLGGRNIYDGYLPRAGTEAFHDPLHRQDILTMRIDYGTGGDAGWYDACRFQFWDDPEAVKPHTNYRMRVEYWGENIKGPRQARYPDFGLVGKIDKAWNANCYEPGTGTPVTSYGGNTSDWGFIEGTWSSGDNNFVPRIYIGLENVSEGKAFIRSVSLREDLGNGQYGPEVLREPSFEYELYYPEESAYALDKIVYLAEEYGVYLKLVLMEKNDMMYLKLDDDGTFVLNGEKDNADGFYGLGRGMNKTRWLQQAWWRYVQARWGYSPHIHSWELINEGDPGLKKHYELADELGKVMHCTVFGIDVSQGDGQKCSYDHPNSHLVTTSFWHSFPAAQFWKNPRYPNVDYADIHAYISTSKIGISNAELDKMQWDSAYYHIGHSLLLGELQIGKPIMRGEAGLDSVNRQEEQPGLALDRYGVWLHNFLWSSLDPGVLIEIYWWGENRERQPGPDGQKGLYEIYRYFANFIGNIPLNNGHYRQAGALLSDPDLRYVGQKDTLNNRAHLWVYNIDHTWKNVVDGVTGLSTSLSGNLILDGFAPNIILRVEWHVFTTYGTPVIKYSSTKTDHSGRITLALPIDPQITDVGIKIGDYSAQK